MNALDRRFLPLMKGEARWGLNRTTLPYPSVYKGGESYVMQLYFLRKFSDGANPTRPANKLTLSNSANFTVIMNQMKYTFHTVRFEQPVDCFVHIEPSFLQRCVRKCCCMEVTCKLFRPVDRSQDARSFVTLSDDATD